ncbi:hypothetical protein GW17_00015012 [Ensete ventricosum]|nr:hypothetical protein GW17_00015012 [Ensete ventricosum]
MATASPLAGVTDHLQGGRPAIAKSPLQGGGRLRPSPLQGRPPAMAASPRARTAAARPQGPVAHGVTARAAARGQDSHHQGRSLARAAASSGSASARRCHQPARCRPKAAMPIAGAATHVDDVQCRHLRRVVATAAQMGARRGLGHSFK